MYYLGYVLGVNNYYGGGLCQFLPWKPLKFKIIEVVVMVKDSQEVQKADKYILGSDIIESSTLEDTVLVAQ